MSEEKEEVKETPIGEASLQDYKKARAEGRETVAASDASAEDKKEEPQKPKSTGGFQKKIDRLTKHNFTIEEELSKARQELETLRSNSNGNGKKSEEAAPKSDEEPKRESFQSDNEYVRALTRWEVRQELREQAEADARRDVDEREKMLAKSYNERAAEARSRYDDWDKVVTQEVEIPIAVGRAILLMNNGPDVAYLLGSDPELRAELLKLDPIEAVGRAWEISKEMSGKKKEGDEETVDEDQGDEEIEAEEKPVPTTAKLAAPIKPVGTGSTRSTVPLDKIKNFQDYKKARAAGRTR